MVNFVAFQVALLGRDQGFANSRAFALDQGARQFSGQDLLIG